MSRHPLPLLAALTALLLSSPLSAQDYAGAVGYGGGGAWFGDFNRGSPSLALDAGWLATAQAEHWTMWDGRLGLRGTASFTQRPFDTPGDVRDINTWLFDASLLLRPLPVEAGRRVAPFLGVGGGMVSYGFGEGPPVLIEGTDAVYPGDTDRRASVVGSLGVDVFPGFSLLGTRLGIRAEVSDHVAVESPFRRAEGDTFGPVHNVRASVLLIGLVELLR